jgi:hypothetical protein
MADNDQSLLRLNLPTYQTAVQLNKNCTLGTLRKYLEAVVHIPSQKQQIRLFGDESARFLEERHNGLKCTDIGLNHESLIEVEGPTFTTDRSCGIASFSIQFSDANMQPLSLMPRCGLLWNETDCFDHSQEGECHLCQSTGKIMMPLYCPLTPIINYLALEQDILATFDIHGSKTCKYNMNYRRHQYPAAVINLDADGIPTEKVVRIMASDFGRGGRGLDYVTCQTAVLNEAGQPTGEWNQPINSQFRLCIDDPRYSVCSQCTEPIFHGAHAHDPMMWAWCCPGCRCQMHPKCAFDKFTEIGQTTCHCPGCNGNAVRRPFMNIIPSPAFDPNAEILGGPGGLQGIRNDLRNMIQQLYQNRQQQGNRPVEPYVPPEAEEQQEVPAPEPVGEEFQAQMNEVIDNAINRVFGRHEAVDPQQNDQPPPLEEDLPPLEEDDTSEYTDDDIGGVGDEIMALRVDGDQDSDIDIDDDIMFGYRQHIIPFPMRFVDQPPPIIDAHLEVDPGPVGENELPLDESDSLEPEGDYQVDPTDAQIPDNVESVSENDECEGC